MLAEVGHAGHHSEPVAPVETAKEGIAPVVNEAVRAPVAEKAPAVVLENATTNTATCREIDWDCDFKKFHDKFEAKCKEKRPDPGVLEITTTGTHNKNGLDSVEYDGHDNSECVQVNACEHACEKNHEFGSIHEKKHYDFDGSVLYTRCDRKKITNDCHETGTGKKQIVGCETVSLSTKRIP